MPTNIFGTETVLLYWNMEEYPIIAENGVDHCSISHNIISALRLMGARGCMHFRAFGPPNLLDQQEQDLLKAGIMPVEPKGMQEFTSADDAMCRYILSYKSLPKNIVVIAKQKRDSELVRVLKCISTRKSTVVLVQPSPLTLHSLFPTPNSFLGRAQVLGLGGTKLSKLPRLGISYGFPNYDPKFDRCLPTARMVVS